MDIEKKGLERKGDYFAEDRRMVKHICIIG